MTILLARIDSPIGPLHLAASERGLHAIAFANGRRPVRGQEHWHAGTHPLAMQAAAQLSDYFAGRRRAFDLPLAAAGTPFQQDVWQALREIPYGATLSYGELARRIGRASAVRAAAAATARNPLAIVVPCHRVVGARGALTGFAGGLDAKRHLLQLEAGRG